jgi:hypothetical protein
MGPPLLKGAHVGASGASSFSLSRAILQRTARAEANLPLRVIAVTKEVPGDLTKVTLVEAAEYLVVVDAREHEDLHGVDVVMIIDGQEKHPLFEDAEVRRRSRMLG